jgi:putative membrane protein
MRARRIATIARIATTALLAMRDTPAFAHGGSASPAAPLTFGWDFTPWLTALLAVSLVLYGVGFARLHARSGTGRSSRRTQALAFAAGWLALALALVSPLDALSGALFSAHMVEHEAMMLVCAPLIVLGRPLGIMLWAFPHGVRLPIGRALRSRVWTACWRRLASPMWAWSLHALALWAWHAPYLFEAALANPVVHTLQHASFLLTALLFWRGIFGEAATRHASGQAMLSLFTTMVHTGALGALITLAPGVWYPSYIEPTSALGVDPLRDQQLGGLIMWIPGALAYLVGALAVAARWLRERPTASRPTVWLARGAESPALEEPPR